MPFEKLSDIPTDLPLTPKERKELMREMKDARDRLVCAQAILEVAFENAKDAKKREEIERMLTEVREKLVSFESMF